MCAILLRLERRRLVGGNDSFADHKICSEKNANSGLEIGGVGDLWFSIFHSKLKSKYNKNVQICPC